MFHFHLYTVGKAALSGDDHRVARLNAGEEFVFGIETAAKVNLVVCHGAVVVVDVDIFVAGTGLLHNGAVGHDNVFDIAEIEVYTCKHAGQDALAGVGDVDFSRERACGGVDCGIYARNLAGKLLAGECVESDVDSHAAANETHVVLRHVDHHLHDGRQLSDGEHGLLAGHVARVVVAGCDYA